MSNTIKQQKEELKTLVEDMLRQNHYWNARELRRRFNSILDLGNEGTAEPSAEAQSPKSASGPSPGRVSFDDIKREVTNRGGYVCDIRWEEIRRALHSSAETPGKDHTREELS